MLAYARRMLDGQIPHRDFIAIHLAGSGLVHMPFVAFGGGRPYLISRLFVWTQFAWTALAWTLIGRTMLSLHRNAAAEICIALIAFALSAEPDREAVRGAVAVPGAGSAVAGGVAAAGGVTALAAGWGFSWGSRTEASDPSGFWASIARIVLTR